MNKPKGPDQAVTLFAVTTRALIEAMGMQAENMQRAAVGSSMAYSDDHFFEVYRQIENWDEDETEKETK